MRPDTLTLILLGTSLALSACAGDTSGTGNIDANPIEADTGLPPDTGPEFDCGNGVLELGEQCDDGNDIDGDGCDSDCAYTCETAADCTDGDPCNGAEVCDLGARVCYSEGPAEDGTLCAGGICDGGECVPSECGDGHVDTAAREQCDDGNLDDGDGCNNDCRWSCEQDTDCDDGNVCTGAETCDLATHTCQPGTPLADETVCGDEEVEAFCVEGACVPAECGNQVVDANEDCDDGNDVDGDGCDTDCTWSCVANTDCNDGVFCNGVETCNVTTHTCRTPPAIADGTRCTTSGDECWAGVCEPSICGDGRRNQGEDCDDSNDIDGDGCDTECTRSCSSHADCDDGEACNGREFCDFDTWTCDEESPALEDGSSCTVGSGTWGECIEKVCEPIVCGDGRVSSGEECDDGNDVDGDGCDVDCKFSCVVNGQCQDGVFCNGEEVCNLATHTCEPGTPPTCTTGDACLTSFCDTELDECRHIPRDEDGDGEVDAACGGTDCDDTNAWVGETATEICDRIDNDCNGIADDGALGATLWYPSCDGDAYPAADAEGLWYCGRPSRDLITSCGSAPNATWTDNPVPDCGDLVATAYPGQDSWWFIEPYASDAGVLSFDYNCDGVEEIQITADEHDGPMPEEEALEQHCQWGAPGGPASIWIDSVAGCGERIRLAVCVSGIWTRRVEDHGPQACR